ncbi:hypothetical protein A0257_21925 [Hymenobacter psoromatis]|nr:hypothetical protein A0257_21925 [Hymenobacter psoromatis]
MGLGWCNGSRSFGLNNCPQLFGRGQYAPRAALTPISQEAFAHALVVSIDSLVALRFGTTLRCSGALHLPSLPLVRMDFITRIKPNAASPVLRIKPDEEGRRLVAVWLFQMKRDGCHKSGLSVTTKLRQ